jgi:hypothetical protein
LQNSMISFAFAALTAAATPSFDRAKASRIER